MADLKEAEKVLDFELHKVSRKPTLHTGEIILIHQSHGPELTRSLSWLGALGLAFSISNSWIGYAATLGTMLTYGGGQTSLFGAILGGVAQWIVLLGTAELASAFPSSGGHYHFTYWLAPRGTRKLASFTVGMITLLAWWISLISGLIYITTSVFGIVAFWTPGFVIREWQIYLGYLLAMLLSLIPLFSVPVEKTDYMTRTTLAVSIVGLVVTIVILPAMGGNDYHPENIMINRNQSGWATPTGWLLSMAQAEYSFVGAGTIVHLAEETPRPDRILPFVINMTTLIGLLGVIPWVIGVLCGIDDVDAVQRAFVPSLEAYYQVTGSKAAATFLQACIALICYNNGLPFSRYWNHIDPQYKFPVRTALLSAAFTVLFGVIYIASTTAFNSMINITTLLANVAFTIPQGILAIGGRNKLPARHFNLGRFGYPVNIFSVLWLILSGVLFCLPVTLPTTLSSMNYGSVVLVGIFLAILLMYIERRGKFSGPQILHA
ncbi:hypothetical protein P175DRAFT_0510223 [Aspergillus ochraceoroseus IBT 24754]|uniref:Amino acid permease/ SLC12A domain-containing protein n=1 Tax=Aspergillus ochraceoroseus IBT 24754 TaxID=1392256 RepID=A0A2T5LVJ1_9EURO|nr:uncharacterized protein P175DRAFT_0510223 [Aspergillus ochraceoroseus IBT 24754]PTU20299.1 hypothetical protein P175DRAFT_0510223 [Aspergillus ochraceoroseus IBT 24754]